MTFLYKKIYFYIFLAIMFPVYLTAEAGRHSLSLERVPVLAPFFLGGAGIGLSYEAGIWDNVSLKFTGYGAGVPVNTGGFMTLAGGEGAINYFPLKAGREGLIIRSGFGSFYMGAMGERSFGGLESHFVHFYLEEALGWRFLLGKGKVKVIIQSELAALFILPGITGSGPSDNLVWSGTGLAFALLYPNLVVGVNF